MTLANGREFVLIPGPSILPDRVLNAMHRAAMDIYAGPMLGVTDDCQHGLKRIFGTDGDTYIYASNGHGTWEASLTNLFSKGEKILVLESGRFATGWGEMATMLGLDVEVLACDWHSAIDLDRLEERLRNDREQAISAILAVQVDTASGVVNDIGALRKATDAAGHGALLMIDAVASLATMPFDFDGWGVDVAVSGSQKGLMSPAGLGFVAVSARAKDKHRQAGLRTPYWDWTARDGKVHYQKYCGTPPEQLLFGLQEALKMIFEEGLPSVFRRHEAIADATRAAIAAWEAAGATFNIREPASRSNSVSVFCFEDDLATRIIDYCKVNCGVTLGGGLGQLVDQTIRIGHMGHVNPPTILGCLGSIDMALASMGKQLPQTGVGAASMALGRYAAETSHAQAQA
ncbi:alanine--glyoxylate aminotransferase family protein [Hoeflea sp. TYP-13]|uniref:alanine--glyoxylate aminotransferase family protein n=1 Tax=Hoeflea sp. TYP-13 TaxID=3230023 RepID=UPI0034C6578E